MNLTCAMVLLQAKVLYTFRNKYKNVFMLLEAQEKDSQLKEKKIFIFQLILRSCIISRNLVRKYKLNNNFEMQIISFSRYGCGLYLSILTNRMMITATELTFYRTGSTSRLRTCPATSILRESSLLQSETITRSGSKSGDHHQQVSVYSERAGLAGELPASGRCQ